MLNRFVLGTANFAQNYGILSKGCALQKEEVKNILHEASELAILTLDTASAYGDMSSFANDMKGFNIISKWSVANAMEETFLGLKLKLKNMKKDRFYALLIHDPQNLQSVSAFALKDFCQKLKNEGICEKVGISIYDEEDWKSSTKVMEPDIIQLPLSPLNQALNQASFVQELANRGVEVHARSLFLQGVLLQEKLPDSLKNLKPLWDQFLTCIPQTENKLSGLLHWALSQTWIHKWVIGVSSLENLMQIARSVKDERTPPNFDSLKEMHHAMVDPRHWNIT